MRHNPEKTVNSPTWQEELRNSKSLYLDKITDLYPQSIPQNFYKKYQSLNSDHPLKKQFEPSTEELEKNDGLYDPIGDQIHAKGNGIIHRYKNRLLFTPTTVCPIQCRYCFRKNELHQNDEIFKKNTNELIHYLELHPEVKEVILTGGDPLILSNKKIFELLDKLKSLVPYIRFHSRTPIIIPSRIDQDFVSLIQNFENDFKVITLAIHTNHASELDEEVLNALKELQKTKIQLVSQSVLLKGVNDDPDILKELFLKLSENRIRPYYLHHPDKVKGGMHFYLDLKTGREIYGRLRDELPGWAIPHYIIDPSNGRGKNLAYNPEKIEFSEMILDRFNQEHAYYE